MIKKTKHGYVVMSHDGKKKLSDDTLTEEEALQRLHEIEFFKNNPKKPKLK